MVPTFFPFRPKAGISICEYSTADGDVARLSIPGATFSRFLGIAYPGLNSVSLSGWKVKYSINEI